MRARAHALPPRRVAHRVPAAIRRLYIRFLPSPLLLRSYARTSSLRTLLLFVPPGGTVASSSFSPSISSPVSFHPSFSSFSSSSSCYSLLFFSSLSLLRQSPSVSLSLLAVSHTRNARAPAIGFSPSFSLPLPSLSVGRRSACLTSRRPTTRPLHQTATRLLSPLGARAGHSFRLVRSVPLVLRAHGHPSLFLAPE